MYILPYTKMKIQINGAQQQIIIMYIELIN